MSRASDRAYHLIRGMILSGELAPGSQLGEEALAERCAVSRTPIRDALRRLEADLLIRRTGTQRSFVADWSLGDVEDAFTLRAMLESHAARRASERMDGGTLEALRALSAGIWRAIRQPTPDVAAFVEGNRQFHALVLEQAGSRRLAALLGTLIEQPVVSRTARQYSAEQLQRSNREHDELIAAFERRDGAWAESVMASHIRRAFHAYADAHHGVAPGSDQTDLKNCVQNAGSLSAPQAGNGSANGWSARHDAH